MYKIFYNPETLKIMGMSNDKNSMEMPYVETKKKYHSLSNLEIIKEKGKHKINVKNGILENVNKKTKNRIRGKMLNNHELTNLINNIINIQKYG
jgi:hypothetical protein